MRKVLFAFFVLTIMAGTAGAQQKKSRNVARLGMKTGLNYSHFHNTGLEESTISADWKTGFVFGFFVEMKIADSMGGKNISTINGENNLRLNYLSVPVSLKYEFAPKFKLAGGVQLSWILQATNLRLETKTDVTSTVRNSDIALHGGVEFWPNKKVLIGAKYLHGLTDVEFYTGTKAFNQGMQFSVGVKL
ncbi:MAG: hypothetical protein B7Z54_06955 [Sphingobacteriales bacterium 12-47-4]|nr:MAG: hypothetical protein B7Z54_06955 [Sphingobacteriales bacterium 12-47-4]